MSLYLSSRSSVSKMMFSCAPAPLLRSAGRAADQGRAGECAKKSGAEEGAAADYCGRRAVGVDAWARA